MRNYDIAKGNIRGSDRTGQ